MTPEQILAKKPCSRGWNTFIKSWGDRPMDLSLSIGDVVITNGVEDAFWCLRLVDDPRLRVRAILPAVIRASKFTKDERIHGCINLLKRFVAGEGVTESELIAACVAADAASRAATYAAAYAAACAAADAADAADAAAYAAACAAADAADAAADAAAYAAACAAACAAEERELQKQDLLTLFPPKVFTP
jgi:hypothetical protein